jgi:hypothetical protein
MSAAGFHNTEDHNMNLECREKPQVFYNLVTAFGWHKAFVGEDKID